VRALVTGANGFLGSAIVRALRERGDEVLAGTRRPAPELERLGARVVALDLADREALRNAFKNVDCVFHVAAKTGVWGPRSEYVASNVTGTQNVLATCEARRVPKLVFTSSPSVVFGGKGHVRASNDVPYPERYLCAYPETKARAEQIVLAANGRWGLATCALRPHLIFGPGDPHLVPRLLARARAGKLVRIGDGANEVTLCAVDNAAHAHLLAADSLSLGAPHAGRAYFIGQEEPVKLWPWIDALLARFQLPPVSRSLSLRGAYALGATLEALWKLTLRSSEPPLTRFVALQLGTSHSYDMAPARRDFGYSEVRSTEATVDALVRESSVDALQRAKA
jgi:nucleoside-diphosphate-sugar epimerase